MYIYFIFQILDSSKHLLEIDHFSNSKYIFITAVYSSPTLGAGRASTSKRLAGTKKN